MPLLIFIYIYFKLYAVIRIFECLPIQSFYISLIIFELVASSEFKFFAAADVAVITEELLINMKINSELMESVFMVEVGVVEI